MLNQFTNAMDDLFNDKFEYELTHEQAEQLIAELKRIGFERVNTEQVHNLKENGMDDEDSETRTKVSKGVAE